MFNSSSKILKRGQFFESYWKEGFYSVSEIQKKGWILWVILKESSILGGHVFKKGFDG